MTLNVRVFDPPAQQVGNVAVIGQNNQPFRTNIITSFNYQIDDSDRFAGTLQFATILQLQLSINNAARWIQFRDSQPIEYDLGDYSMSTGNNLFERGKISSLSQAIIHYSRIISLDQNEAARFKTISLTARPRFIASTSVEQGMNINGSVQPGTFALQFNGTLTGPTPGIIAGTAGGNGGPASNAQVVFPRRGFIMDVTTGELRLTTENPPVRPGAQYNNIGDIIALRSIGLFLRPGITGTAKLTVFKAGDTNNDINNPNGLFVATGLPPL